MKISASFRAARLSCGGMHCGAASRLAQNPEVRRKLSWMGVSMMAAVTGLACYGAPVHAASKLKVLYSFRNVKGTYPECATITDGAGNLYGTAAVGGAHGDGVVFKLSPPPAGQKSWTESVLHSFGGADGANPLADLIADGAGNLFGTTGSGGSNGFGLVFELSPPINGQRIWTETVLHSFAGRDGQHPSAGLVADAAGNLYGTTPEGGGVHGYRGYGVVFELSPPAGGRKKWTESVLRTLSDANGKSSYANLIMDGAGNLYGTTSAGGVGRGGLVFELSPPAQPDSEWTETILYAFSGADGKSPVAGLFADGTGNLYGTTSAGGKQGRGTVFELSPPQPGGTWTETVLYSFSGIDGENPNSEVIEDKSGNIFGTTISGGANGFGVAFELRRPPTRAKTWKETVVQSFIGGNGAYPSKGLTADGAGNFYSTTLQGGTHDEGVVFELTP